MSELDFDASGHQGPDPIPQSIARRHAVYHGKSFFLGRLVASVLQISVLLMISLLQDAHPLRAFERDIFGIREQAVFRRTTQPRGIHSQTFEFGQVVDQRPPYRWP